MPEVRPLSFSGPARPQSADGREPAKGESGSREIGEFPWEGAAISEIEARSTGRVLRGEFRALGVLSIIVGFLLLLEEAGYLVGVHLLWPVFPAFVGFGLAVLFFERGRRDPLMLGIGGYLLAVSGVFFVCNYTSWAPLARAWPVFIALFGVVSVAASPFAERTRRILWASGLFLIVLAAAFFLVFQVDARLWPLTLVLLGTWILLVTWVGRRIGDKHV
ncbi:MAG: hypothetical protein ACUVYA_06795 [Planctomycetota bacterium]